jgi:preprotein translocase subunit SecD
MNQYPLWKNLLILGALLIGLLYAAPNFFGVSHAVQVQPKSDTLKVDAALKQRVEDMLKAGNFNPEAVSLDATHVNIYFRNNDAQNKAKEMLEQKLGDDYVVLLNLLPRAPHWMMALHALPMYFGLDLRGGMHLLLQVDMKVALDKALETTTSDIRSAMIEHDLNYAGLDRDGDAVTVKFRDADARSKAEAVIRAKVSGAFLTSKEEGGDFLLVAKLKQEELKHIEEAAIQQNLLTLRNRLNGLGLGEPVIQQQGVDRIVVQLPGVQDPKRVHEIIGRTATLQLRMVDMDAANQVFTGSSAPPLGDELYKERNGNLLPVKKEIIFTGKRITGAQQGFDQNGAPAVFINLDSVAANRFKRVTHDNIGKRMAIIMFEKSEKGAMTGTVITAPVIQDEIPNGRVQISGSLSSEEAADIALLLRSGALAAPMTIAEERTVGPSLGEKNISNGFHSTWVGFAAVTLFMIAYYMVFGTVSILSLVANLLLLVALLSMMQATLTLPGMAGIALTLGMAIDANVLINERIREELRHGVTPQMAIHAGYDRAFATILDSNVTTLIAGIALLAFGTGPVKGFAVVLCLGIATSMFSAVLVSRALVNLIYGRRARLSKVAIG